MRFNRPDFCLAVLLVLSGGLHPAAAAEKTEKITFQDHALPILRQRCSSCHDAGTKEAGLDVTSFVGIMQGGGSGEVIAPGDASGSYLYRLVTHEDEPTMPPDSPAIPKAEQEVLRKWIEGGVLETASSVAMLPKKKAQVAMTGSTMERPAVVPVPARLPLEPAIHTAAIDGCTSIATSPWAAFAAVAGQRQVLLYDTRTLSLTGVLPFPEGRPHIVRFSRGGGLVLAGGGVGAASGRVVLWDLRSGRRVQEVGDELDVVLAADISPDQRMVALGGPKRVVRVFSAETGDLLHEHTKHTDWVQAVSYSPDGVLLATADRSGGVFLWEAATGRDYMTINAHPAAVTGVAWRSDANMLATACEDGQIRLWELENGKLVKNWTAHGGGVAAIEFTRDGRIASVGRDKVAKLWKTDGNQERAFEALADVGLAISYCDETNRLIAGDWTGEVRVFNAADGARLGQLQQNPAPLAERVAAAERAMADRRQQLDAATKAVTGNRKSIAQLTAAIKAAAAERTRLEGMLADLATQQQQMQAGLENAKKAHAELLPQLAAAKTAVATSAENVKKAEAAVAAAGDAAEARKAAEQALAAARTAQTEAGNRHNQLEQAVSAKAADVAAAEKTVADLAARSQTAKTALTAAETKRQESETAAAAAQKQMPQLDAALTAAKAEAAAAAEQMAHWYDQIAFQANYNSRLKTLQEMQAAVEQTQIALAEAEAARQAVEQTKQKHEAKLGELRKQLAAIEAAKKTAGQEIADLATKLKARAGEITATQADIEKLLQATAAIERSGKSLDEGLAVLPEDPQLKAARAAVAEAVKAKQAEVKARQDALASLMAGKAEWEKAVVERQQRMKTHEADLATSQAAIAAAEKQLAAAVSDVEKAAAAVQQQTGALTEKQATAKAAETALNSLQGIAS